MGLLSTTSSSVEAVAGRIRFTPAPPDPWWICAAEVLTWIGPALLLLAALATGDWDVLTIVIGVFWGIAVASWIAGRVLGRALPSPPKQPFDLPDDLVVTVRRLAFDDRDVEAMRTVREALGVGLVDARRIVDAAVGRTR